MNILKHTFSLLCLLTCAQFLSAQVEACYETGTTLDLNSLIFPNCSGPLTYDLAGAGLNCTECETPVNLANSGTVTVTAFSEGMECDELTLQIAEPPSIILTESGATNCNEFTYAGSSNESIVNWSWDFISDGEEDANGQSGTYLFNANGNQSVTLTTTTALGCEVSTSMNQFINGPWAEASFTGDVNGNEFPLPVFSFNNIECVVSYCVTDLTVDNTITIFDVFHPNSTGTNNSYIATFNGTEVHNANTPIPGEGIIIDMSTLGMPGYNEFEYIITDSNGCVFVKEYGVYWESFTISGADIENTTEGNIVNYCYDENLEFTITASQTEGVSYDFFIGCQNSTFDQLVNNAVYSQVLDLEANQTEVINWISDATSCGCAGNSLSAYLFTTNPCNVVPFQVGTASFQVSEDPEADFTFPEVTCINAAETMSWIGPANLPLGGTCGGFLTWSVTEPDENTISNAGNATDLDYTFDQFGVYNVCLTVSTGVGCSSNTICNQICVQDQITQADAEITWPMETDLCVLETFQPVMDLPALQCEDATIIWSVNLPGGASAFGLYALTGNGTETPSIEFLEKGDYLVNAQVISECGSPLYTQTLTVGAAPLITVNEASLASCPEETICFDSVFCVDDCNSAFSQASVTVYEGSIADCSAPITNTEVWASAENPLVPFPADMIGEECMASDIPCDFSWQVPADAQENYTLVIEVTNACGSEVVCVPIAINVPGTLDVPVPDEVCAGFTIDPGTTTLNLCEWSVDDAVVWSPGDVSVITINEDVNITINCNTGACPESTTKDVGVFAPINPIITGDTEICIGGSVPCIVSSDMGVEIQWYEGTCMEVNAGSATLILNETSPEYLASAPGSYSAVVIDENGCAECAEHAIALEVPPAVTCGNQVFCETEINELVGLGCVTVPAGGTISWEILDETNAVVTTTAEVSYTVADLLADFGLLSANHVFTANYEVNTSNACTYTGSYTITIDQLGVSAVSEQAYCSGETLELIGGTEENWQTGNLPLGTFLISGGNLELLESLPDGSYSGINYDSGCSQQPYEITVFSLPQVGILGNDFICDNFGEELILNTSSSGELPLSYQWRSSSCAAAPMNLAGATNPFISLDAPGDYSVLLTDGNGCSVCSGTQITLDPRPAYTCEDVSICENLEATEIDVSCVTLPAGANSSAWVVSHLNNTNFPAVISDPFTVDELLTIYDPQDQQVTLDEQFTIYHQWVSDNNCLYLDSSYVTILDEAVGIEQIDICSGDILDLAQPLAGDWVWTTAPASSANSLASTEFSWAPQLSDAGTVYELRFTSASGCGATDYSIQVHATPELSISTPNVNMCMLSEQVISVNQGIATDITVDYVYDLGTVSIPEEDLNFSPTALGITNTDPGQLHLQGSITYATLMGTELVCSAEAFQNIDIVDTLESLAVPEFICQGAEFDMDLCADAAVSDFDFSLGGENYSSADCPFSIPTLFGTQAYELVAAYGSEFALQCQVQSSGNITIQEQLAYTYYSESIPCTGEQEISIEVLSGNTSNITLLADDVLLDTPLFEGESFTETILFTPANSGVDEVFDFEIQITDGVCTTEVIADQAQYIATPELGISIDELTSDFDGCGTDFLNMQISVPNINFIDETEWSIEADYFPGGVIAQGVGLFLPDEIEIPSPPLESAVVIISAIVSNQCGTDSDTVFHVMNPIDIQLQIDELEAAICPGETIEVNSIVNLEEYMLEAVFTPEADIDWDPLTETIIVGNAVPAGTYSVEFTATGNCGEDVAFGEFDVFAVFSAEFDYSGFTCINEEISFNSINSEELSGFQWDFGDTGTAQSPDPVYAYEETGTYEVSLSAYYSGSDCQVFYSEEVVIGGSQLQISPGDFGYCGSSEAAYSIDLVDPLSVEWTITNPYTSETITYLTESTPLLEFDFEEEANEVAEYVISAYAVDSSGCPSEQEVTASVYPAPKAEIVYSVLNGGGNITTSYSGDLLQVFLGIPCQDAEIEFFNKYDVNNCFWTNNLGEMCDQSFDNCSSLTYCTETEDSGQLVIQVDNEFQCTATDVLDVEFVCADKVTLFVPNSFTPNQDGINDVFEYSFRGVVEEFELFIFNRWGETVFHSEELNDFWDGSDERGHYYVPNGVYNWVIKVNDDRQDALRLQGHVTIIR